MILIIGDFHHKNKIGLINILKHLNLPYKFNDLSYRELIFLKC